MKIYSIAVDGPSGSGKSTVSKIVAQRLGIPHLDTGAMYRALGYKALKCGIDPADAESVKTMLETTEMCVVFDEQMNQSILLDGEEIMGKIRTSEVSKAGSDIATIPEVRLFLVEKQRSIAQTRSIIMDGRDIGSYVLPDSPHKFYITAPVEVRAYRRWFEMQEKGLSDNKTINHILKELLDRDRTDSTREFAPLKRTEDAVYIDTGDMNAEQVADIIINRVTGDD